MPLPKDRAELLMTFLPLRDLAREHHDKVVAADTGPLQFETAAFCACGRSSDGPAGTKACEAIAALDQLAAVLKFTAQKTRTRKHQFQQIGESLWECRVCQFEGAGYGPGASEWADTACPGKPKP